MKKIIILANRLLLSHDVLLQDQFIFHLLLTINDGSTRPEQAKVETHEFGRKKIYRVLLMSL